MKLGAQFKGKVRNLSTEGLGVVNSDDGQVFFVRGTWPGDEGLFEVTQLEKRYGYAKVIEIGVPSQDRRQSPCVYQGTESGKCGGCPWMIGSYSSQIAHKQYRLEYALERSKLTTPECAVNKILPSAELGYRNRAQFKTEGTQIGFVSVGEKTLAPVKDCLVLNEELGKKFQWLQSQLPKKEWVPKPPYKWSFIDIDDDFKGEEIALNSRRPFKQGNAKQNEKMKSWLREKLAQRKKSKGLCLELFCGSGNFTEVLAERGFDSIVALEVNEESLIELKKKKLPSTTARAINLGNEQNYAKLAQFYPETNTLFLDPPREGAKGIESLVTGLKHLQTIFYVSCDLATFIRDAAPIVKNGYALKEIQGIDLFPQTPHLEVMAWFEKIGP